MVIVMTRKISRGWERRDVFYKLKIFFFPNPVAKVHGKNTKRERGLRANCKTYTSKICDIMSPWSDTILR